MSRFTLAADVVDPASEVVLLDRLPRYVEMSGTHMKVRTARTGARPGALPAAFEQIVHRILVAPWPHPPHHRRELRARASAAARPMQRATR